MEGPPVATDHWFDELHRTLTEEAPRRGLFRSTGALLGGLALGTASQVGSAKKNRKGKKDKKKGRGNDKKDKKKDDPWGCEDRFQNLRIKDANCSDGQCKASYPNDPCEEKYCEFVCNQCDGEDTRQFCISDILSGKKIAACCTDGAACCDGMCCGGFEHPELKCCQDGCKATNNDRENCGSCGNRCAPEENCVDGQCQNRCGGPCPVGQTCRPDGTCGCLPGYKYCPLATRCVVENAICCGGLPLGFCYPGSLCCGSGLEAYCTNQTSCPDSD
jgi:hypothetical protein